MASDELRALARKIRCETRAAQGLPPTTDDPVTLDRLAALFHTSDDRTEAAS
jgi:hypothetical protein